LTALESDVSALEASNFWSYISANQSSITRLNTASNALNTSLNTLNTRYLMTSNAVNSNATAISVLNTATSNLQSTDVALTALIVSQGSNLTTARADINTIKADNIARDAAVVTLQYATNHLKSRIDADVATMTTLLGLTNTFLTADKGVVTNAMPGGIGTGNGEVTVSNNVMTVTFPSRSDLDEWSYHLAHSDVDIANYNLNNVKTLFCTQIVLNGVALTNWSQGGFTPTAPVAGARTTTVTIEYPNRADAGLWHGVSGTLYCYMWNNREMYGYPQFTTNWVISGNLPATTTKTITNTTDFLGNTYWYAWFDVDGDGAFNNIASSSSSGGLLLEPGALGEFMPLYYTNYTDTATLTFVLVDMKGQTYRYGWATPPSPIMTGYITESGVNRLVSSLFHRNFVCEQDYMLDGYSDGGILGNDVSSYNFVALSGSPATYWASKTSFPHQDPSGGGTPVPNYPVSGQTISSPNIVFKWTNNYRDLSAVRLRLSTSITGTPVLYEQMDYMENEHIDGTVRLLVSPATGCPALANGTTYYWQIGLGNGAGTISLTSTWGSTARFVYQP